MHANYPPFEFCLIIKCPNLWAHSIGPQVLSYLIPQGRLYLRPLQRYFHSLGLTDLFTPPRRSDPLVLASLLQQWQDLSFLTSGIPIHPFQAEFTIFTDAFTQGWAPTWGFPNSSGPRAPYQLLGTQGGRGGPTSVGFSASGPPGHDSYGQFDCFIYQQARRDPVPHLVTSSSGAFYVITSLQAQNIHVVVRARQVPGCLNLIADHLSHPNQPITTEWSLHPEIVNQIFRFWGDSSSGHVCTCFKLPPFSVHISDSGATSTRGGCSVSGLAGKVNVHVSTFSPAQQSHSETTGQTGGRGNSDSPLVAETVVVSHLLRLCVDHPLFFPYRQDLLSQQDQKYVLENCTVCLHLGSRATLQSSRLFRQGL